MRVAFYAPLKPPDHPVPSGDRRVARLLLEALRQGGHRPVVASRLRSRDGVGDPSRQTRIAARGRRTAERLIAAWRGEPRSAPELWLTYHLYYKAPDWLGPAVTAALGIPYVVVEASLAQKRAGGAWAQGHRAVEAALRRADRVIGLNPADRDGVLPALAAPERWMALAPFVDAAAYRPAQPRPGPVRLITVAMMRPGDKLASYAVLGAALAELGDLPWTLDIVGDGPARDSVAAALNPLGARVRFAGALDRSAIAGRLCAADLFVWPAINEAFGMAALEAQASALPVVAGASGGVGGIVADGVTGVLTQPGDAAAFAAALRPLILDPERCRRMGAAARAKVLLEHDVPVAAARLSQLIAELFRARAA